MSRWSATARWRWALAGALAGYFPLRALDGPVFRRVYDPAYVRGNFHDMLYLAGWLPVWVVVGAGMALAGGRVGGEGPAWRRWMGWGLAVPVAGALAGLVAEVMKRVVGRERPVVPAGFDPSDPSMVSALGATRYKPLLSGLWDGHNLGFPSSHAAVAVGAATVLTLWYPRAGPVWAALAVGCVYQRLAQGAHFLTDVYVGGVIGAAAGVWMVRVVGRKGVGT